MPSGGNHRGKSPILRKLEGNRRKIGRAALEAQIEREPKGRGEPVVPPHLSAAEQAEFRHVLDSAPLTILTAADQALIENYVVATCAAREAHEALLKTGKLVQSPNGPVTNPYWRLWRQAVGLARLLGSDLGLSPAARARISVEPVQDKDPMELLLGMTDDPAGDWALPPKTRQ